MWKSPVLFFVLTISIALASLPAYKIVKSRAYAWLLYEPDAQEEWNKSDKITDVFLVLIDHWEPGRDAPAARQWLNRYREIATTHRDVNNRPLKYTWAYPCDGRNTEILPLLSEMVFEGFGEVELHWHHHHNNTKEFEEDLQKCIEDFNQFGALIHENSTHPQFVFVHGNWALDNSEERYCGISTELDILQQHGAYADMTFPALGNVAQPRQINSIYRANDDPEPKSYDAGKPVIVGESSAGLMMIPGPLGLDFRNPLIFFEYGALDDQEITGFVGRVNSFLGRQQLWQPRRVNNWLRLAPRVVGKPEWVFIKLHAHGMQHSGFIFELIDDAVTSLEDVAASRGIKLHFVSAREAYNVIRSLEVGEVGPPARYFDFEVARPLNQIRKNAGL